MLALCTFVFFRLYSGEVELSALYIGKEIGIFLILSWSIGVLAFLTNKNNLSQNNSYNILLFSVFLAFMPAILQNDALIMSNFFVLLAIRRIISLKSKLSLKKKLFDAGFWIAIASLFYFWSLLFFVLIIAALLLFAIEDIKNWIIPFVGFIVVAILYSVFYILTENHLGSFEAYWMGVSVDFTPYNHIEIILGITIMTSLGLWATVFYLKNLREKTRDIKAALMLIFIGMLIGISIVFLASEKTGAEFVFVLAPMALVMTNYIEAVENKWFAEMFMWFIIATPIIALML